MSLEDIAKANADKTRLDRMRRVTKPKQSIRNATYLGKAEDGTDIVQVDGQIGATSGHRLISNKPMSEGDRVQMRPSPNGLQRVDAKNQPPQQQQQQVEVIDILEFYTTPNFINHINMTEISEYTITLEKLGENSMTITKTTDASVDFELNASAFTIGTDTPISFSGNTASLKVIFTGTDPRRLILLFYNGAIDKKGSTITKSATLFNFFFGSFDNSLGHFSINCVLGKDFSKTSTTFKSEIIAKTTTPNGYVFDINSTEYTITGSQKKLLKFTGYPKILDSYLFLPPLPVAGRDVKLALQTTEKSKGHVLKKLQSTIIKTLSSTGKIRYQLFSDFDFPAIGVIGDFLYPSLDASGVETAYTASITSGDPAITTVPFSTYYNSNLNIAPISTANLPDGTLISITGGSLPSPLTASSYYFYRITPTTFGLSETEGGDLIEITGQGFGYITFDSGARSESLEMNGLNYTVTFPEIVSGSTLSAYTVVFQIASDFWTDFILRYTLVSDGGLGERLQVEFTANELIETQYVNIGFSGSQNMFFSPIGLADSDTLNIAVRFKRELGSTWFQI